MPQRKTIEDIYVLADQEVEDAYLLDMSMCEWT